METDQPLGFMFDIFQVKLGIIPNVILIQNTLVVGIDPGTLLRKLFTVENDNILSQIQL